MRTNTLLTIAIFIICFVVFISCAAPAPQTVPTPTAKPGPAGTDTPVKGGKLVVSFTKAPALFGYPPKIVGSAGQYARPFFERLITTDDKGAYQPELATSWEIAPDGKSITFKLRQGVKFHDGTDFNADAVKFNYTEYLPPKPSIISGVSSLDVVDPYTIRLNIPAYSNLIMYQLATDIRLVIASPTAIKKNGADWATVNPVGTGPFKLKQYERNVSIKYIKNPDYWDKNLPYLDEMDCIAIPDPMTQLAAFKAGDVHVLYDAKPQIVQQLAKEGYELIICPGTLQSIVPNTKDPDSVFTNKKVREAIEYAIDKEAIASGPGMGLYKSAYHIVLPASVDYNPA